VPINIQALTIPLAQGVKDRRCTFVDESGGVTNKKLDGRCRPKTIQSPWRDIAEWLLRDTSAGATLCANGLRAAAMTAALLAVSTTPCPRHSLRSRRHLLPLVADAPQA
jgi:hypothetical protein